jgi:ligand-binding sensor domain-containing protein
MKKIFTTLFFGLLLSGTMAQSWEIFNSSNSSIPFNSVKSIHADNRGWIWATNDSAGNHSHITWLESQNWNTYQITDKVLDVASDSKGNMYFSTSAREIINYHENRWITKGSILFAGSTIDPLYCDKNDVLWIAKSGSINSVIKYNGTEMSEYSSLNSSFPASAINCMSSIGNTIWIGTKTAGLVKYDDNSFTNYNTKNSPLTSQNISALATQNDTLWIFSGNKLISYTNNFSTSYSYPGKINAIDMLIDKKGNFWILSDIGLIKFNRKDWQIFNAENSPLPSDELTCFTIDKFDNIWIGTRTKGIFHKIEIRSVGTEQTIADFNLNAYPNPIGNQLNISFNMPNTGNAFVDMINLEGKTVMTKNFGTVKQGNASYVISLPDLPKGTYLLRITTPAGSDALKLIK